MYAWRLGISEGLAATIGEKKNEMERAVSQGHLERFEPMQLHDYIPILISQCRFQMPLPGWGVWRVCPCINGGKRIRSEQTSQPRSFGSV